jgi:hypothetical protein
VRTKTQAEPFKRFDGLYGQGGKAVAAFRHQ